MQRPLIQIRIDDIQPKQSTLDETYKHRTPVGTSTDGSWVYRPSLLSDRQLHVVLFAQSADRVDVYAHNEYNWLRHPIKHAKQKDIRREEGAEQIRRWLDAQAIDYDHASTVYRRARHLVERFQERLSSHDSLISSLFRDVLPREETRTLRA